MVQVAIVFEAHQRLLQDAVALNVNGFVVVDQNIGDRWILQERLQRTESEDLVENFLDDPVLFDQAERRLLFLHQLRYRGADFRAHPLPGHRGQSLEIDPVQQLAVQRELELLVFRSVTVLREKPVDPSGLPVFPRSRD